MEPWCARWRCRSASQYATFLRKRAQAMRDEEEREGALRIQALYRGRRARRSAYEIKLERAVLRVQCACFGCGSPARVAQYQIGVAIHPLRSQQKKRGDQCTRQQ